MPESTESVALAPEIQPPRELPTGSLVAGRYRVVALLGRGGFAHVYRAGDESSGGEVALKVLRADRFTAAALRRLEREAALASGFDHPNLVRVLDAGRDSDLAYLAMELVEGETLRQRLAGGPLPVAEAERVAAELLAGLTALHAHGVLHRDIKPGNVLLDRDGRARLADLGLALPVDRDETRATTTAAIVGTVDYLSPEQALGEELDERSDLYALGLVLFEALAGRLAYEGTSTLGTLLARLRTPPADLRVVRPEVPPWLAAFVARLLEREPAARYPSATAALADLGARRAPRRRWRPPRALPRGFWPLAAAALLAVAVGLVIWPALGPSRRFASLSFPDEATVEARGARGEVLWRREGIVTDRGMPVVRLEPGGPPVVAAVLRAPEEFRPEVVRRLAFLDAATGETVREAELLGLANTPPRFPGMSDRFEPFVAAADLDGDGAEEILVTFLHEIYWPSYTVLYEPRLGRARPVLTASGHHRFAGAEDLDGDGRAELLFFGINNRMGYQTAVAAVAPVPPVGDATELAVSQETLAGSPDRIATGGGEGETHWYALLEGRPAAPFLKIDRAARRIVVSGPGGEGAIALGYDGFRVDRPVPAGLAPASRQELRRQAYRALRDAVQLREAGRAEAPAKAREAAELARRVGEEGLAAWAPVVEGTALAAAGEIAAAERLFAELAVPGPQAVETALRAGEAFFLAGERERAVAWYRRGLELVREPAAGRNPAALLDGLVFARAADGRYGDAESELATFGLTHPHLLLHAEALRLFLRWREGESPDPRRLAEARATDLWRYWSLELRLARGEAPAAILEALAGERLRASETLPLLLSLEGECLALLGRRAEAFERAREALDALGSAPLARVALEAHRPLVAERLARLTAAGSG